MAAGRGSRGRRGVRPRGGEPGGGEESRWMIRDGGEKAKEVAVIWRQMGSDLSVNNRMTLSPRV